MADLTAVRPEMPPLDLAEAARLPSGTVLERLGVTLAGLSTPQADERLRTVGPNVLVTHKVTAVGVLLRQLHNPLLILLLAAAAVSGATGDPTRGGRARRRHPVGCHRRPGRRLQRRAVAGERWRVRGAELRGDAG